jgi:amino acid transporter
VVTVASKAFSPRWGALGGMLITVDYFLTSSISATSAFYDVGSVLPFFEQHVVAFACAGILFLAILNVVGIGESATVSPATWVVRPPTSRVLPRPILARNRTFGTPHVAIAITTVVPIAVVIATHGQMVLLGDMYAFGLLGAFVPSSFGLDVMRWRRHRRGVTFYVGLLTSAMVFLAWCVNLFAKPLATLFGGSVTLVGMMIALGMREGWLTEALLRDPVGVRGKDDGIPPDRRGRSHRAACPPADRCRNGRPLQVRGLRRPLRASPRAEEADRAAHHAQRNLHARVGAEVCPAGSRLVNTCAGEFSHQV